MFVIRHLFLIFFLLVAAEVYVLIQVSDWIGGWETLLLVIVTGMVGSWLCRVQGLSNWVNLNQKLQEGELPGKEIVEGGLLMLGGFLLMVPGFITDMAGLFLLIPFTRRGLARYMLRRGVFDVAAARRRGFGGTDFFGYDPGSSASRGGGGRTFEGEVVDGEKEDAEGELLEGRVIEVDSRQGRDNDGEVIDISPTPEGHEPDESGDKKNK